MFHQFNNFIRILPMLCFLGTISVVGQQIKKTLSTDTIPLDTSVRFGKLSNGFTYYIYNNPLPEGEIIFNSVTKAGTLHENRDQLEYAHLIEHIGSRGTQHFPRLKDFFIMSDGQMKAYTSFIHTNYIANLPSKNNATLDNGLQVIYDWSHGIKFSPQTIVVEQGAVLGEMRTTTPSKRWVYDTIMEFVRRNSGLKAFNREKNEISVNNLNQKKLLRFYSDWYRPDLQAAIIVGDVNVDTVESKLKLLFSDLKKPSTSQNLERIEDNYKINLSGENHYISIIDSVWNNFQLNIVSVRPSKSWGLKTPDNYESMLIEELMKELIQPRINSTFSQYDPPFKMFSLNYQFMNRSTTQLKINFDTSHPEEIKQKILRAMTSLQTIRSDITQGELSKAKSILLKKYIKGDTVSSSIIANRLRNHFVRQNAFPNPKYQRKLVNEILSKITLDQVNNYNSECLNFERNTNFIFILPNENIKIPVYNIFESWLNQVKTVDIIPISGHDKIYSLKKIAKIPFKNDTEVETSSKNLINVTTINLRNNIKILLKPDVPGIQNIIRITAYRPLPISIKDKKSYLAATVAGEVINHSGVSKYDKFILKSYMANHGIRGLNFNFDNSEQVINGSCKEESLEELLSLLYLYIMKPRKDLVAFQDWKQQKKENLLNHNAVSSKGGDIFSEMRNPNIAILDEVTLNELTIDKIYNTYNKYFSSIDGYTFIITGNYKEEKVASTLVRYLSAFLEKTPTHWKENCITSEYLKKLEDTLYVKNLDQALIQLSFPVKVSTDLKTKIVLSILKRALNSRIWKRLRKGCYSPTAHGSFVDVKNGIYEFEINFDSKLGNQNRLIQYAMEEFRTLRDEGIDIMEFNKLLSIEKSDWNKCLNGLFPDFWYKYLKDKLIKSENLQTEVLQYSTILEHFISVNDINYAAKVYLNENYMKKLLVLPKKSVVNNQIIQ